jgi:hypothetical protein
MPVEIRKHHQKAIEKLTERYADDPAFEALIIGGSIAKGTAREDSDLDVIFIASDEEYARRKGCGETTIFPEDICDYPSGYVDGKIVDFEYVRAAAKRGSEPTRDSFTGAFVAYSRLPGLEEIIQRIPVYQEHEQQDKIESFYSQIALLRHFFWHEANKRQDAYLKMRVVADLVLFGGRLILAHNKILFPSHKRMMEYVEKAPEKPTDFARYANDLLNTPNEENIERFYNCVDQFRDWNVKVNTVSRFIDDIELSWLNGKNALAER